MGGNIVYFGLTNKLEHYLLSNGFENETNSSISEWILDQTNGDFVSKDRV